MILDRTLAILVLLTASCFAADVDGKWTGSMSTPNGDVPVTFAFKTDGAALTGSTSGPDGSEITIANGKADGNNISFTVTFDFGGMPLTISYKGVVARGGRSHSRSVSTNSASCAGFSMIHMMADRPCSRSIKVNIIDIAGKAMHHFFTALSLAATLAVPVCNAQQPQFDVASIRDSAVTHGTEGTAAHLRFARWQRQGKVPSRAQRWPTHPSSHQRKLRLQQHNHVDLANRLSDFATMDRPVLDKTALGGPFDLTLDSVALAMKRGAGPSIFTAISETGLQLRPATEPIKIVAINAANKRHSAN